MNVIGDLNDLPDKSRKAIEKVIKETNNNNNITLTIALSYSSRWEITNSIKKYIMILLEVKLN